MKQSIKQVIKSDYSLSVISKIITALIGIVSSAFATRYLGVQYKGNYAYISQVANIIVLVLNMGIYQSYSYNYKQYGHSILQKYVDLCFIQFVVFVLIMLVLVATIKNPTICMIIMLVPFGILKLQYGNIVLIENIRLSLFMSIINSVISMICYIALYLCASPGIVYVIILTMAIDFITVSVYTFKLKLYPHIRNIDIGFYKSILKFGFIPMLSGLLATINYSVDIIFLKRIGLQQELSYYALAANIINYVWLIPDAFKSVLFSKSGKKFDKDNIEFSSQVSSLFIIICLVGFAIFGRLVLKILYGIEFDKSYGVTILLILGAFSMSLYKLLGVVLVSQGKRHAHFYSLLISAIVNVILNMILIPHLGMYGAGIASVFSYTLCGVILLIYFCNLYKMKPISLLLPSKKTIEKIFSIAKKSKTENT